MFNNKEELKKWITDYIDNKGKRSLHIAINNSKYIKDYILELTGFLPIDTKYNQRCYHIINDIITIPMCRSCKLKTVNFNNRDKDWKYLDYCSSKCGRINKTSMDRYKKTCLEKYGFDNYSKSEEFKNNMKKYNLEKYGVECYQQTNEFNSKSIKTCLEKYGVSSYTKTKEFTDRLREIFIKNWGVNWYTKSEDFTNKFRETCLEKYGTVHHMLNDDFLDNINFYKGKDYKLPSGKIIRVQGYENYAIDILLNDYREDDIMITYADIKNEIGVLNYIMDDKDKIYLPDIYIKSENKIIEVKSLYVYEVQLDKNILKKESCIRSGMLFEFWIISPKGKLLEII